MWMMLQQDQPTDYVIGTGQSNSVQDFVELAFEAAELDWRRHVESDPRYIRPAKVDAFVADASKAASTLSWQPKTYIRDLVRIMVDADLALLDQQLSPKLATHR